MHLYTAAKAWPFQEARKVQEHAQGHTKTILFETGYGPSGLPHIGTFAEVLRTSMVRHAFSCLSEQPTQLVCFSDDMDGLRKVPSNIPNPDRIAPFLHYPLTQVPDPFGQYESFGEHNNARLCAFLDSFGFDYTFKSATACYKSGLFDKGLLAVLSNYQKILDVMLPTLGKERQATYSPFLPISPKTGHVLQVPMEAYHPDKGTVVFLDEDGTRTEVPVTGGHCKLQWKVDWGMRWYVLGIDYEMAGKDLIDSVTLAKKICTILKGVPPEGLICEHFLDQEGRKISKSVGNGISIEDWLAYAPQESLAYFIYQNPTRAKRLSFDIIPRCVDEYLQLLAAYPTQSPAQQLENPVWHIHAGNPPTHTVPLNFSLLLNLASVCQAEDTRILWYFIKRYTGKDIADPFFDTMVSCAVRYYQDFVAPHKTFRKPSDTERKALMELSLRLQQDVSAPQDLLYDIGKKYFPDMKQWFSCLYEVLLGQSEGPRMGSFIAIYGAQETRTLIEERLQCA